MNEATGDTVECPEHGTQGLAFVCRHLNLREPVGFVEGYDPNDPDRSLFQAWFGVADDVLVREGEWNDRSEAFRGIRLVCRVCYRQTKALNKKVR